MSIPKVHDLLRLAVFHYFTPQHIILSTVAEAAKCLGFAIPQNSFVYVEFYDAERQAQPW